MDGLPIACSLTAEEKEALCRRIPEAAAWASQSWPPPLTDTTFRSRDLWPEGYSDASYSWWEPPVDRIRDWIDEVSTKRADVIADLSLEVPSLESALEKGSILAHDIGACAGSRLAATRTPFFDSLDNSAWDTWLLLAKNESGDLGPLWLSWIPLEHVEDVQSAVGGASTDCLLWVDAGDLGLLESGGESMAKPHKPDGYSTVSPYLIVNGAEGTIEFLGRVLGAVELRRFPGGPGKVHHAEVRIDDTVVMLADPPPGAEPVGSHVHVYVPDVDAAYRKALEAGAISVQAPMKKEDPDRRGAVRDAGGTTWWIATKVE